MTTNGIGLSFGDRISTGVASVTSGAGICKKAAVSFGTAIAEKVKLVALLIFSIIAWPFRAGRAFCSSLCSRKVTPKLPEHAEESPVPDVDLTTPSTKKDWKAEKKALVSAHKLALSTLEKDKKTLLAEKERLEVAEASSQGKIQKIEKALEAAKKEKEDLNLKLFASKEEKAKLAEEVTALTNQRDEAVKDLTNLATRKVEESAKRKETQDK